MKLYKDTITARRTLVQEAQVILGPESAAPAGSTRKVQVTIPPSPQVFLGIDVPIQGEFDQPGMGPNRDYGLPPMSPGQRIEFRLNPHQFLTAMSRPGMAFVSLIVEHLEEG